MDTIKIILNEKGQLDTILSDGEPNIQVLQRGKNDSKIDEFESILDVVDY
jgi:hypothetical protein